MDTSEQYIKMCESSKELQEYWKTLVQSDDDVVVGRHYKSIMRWLQKGSMESPPKEDWIWLPRQEQLQKLLLDNTEIEYDGIKLHWRKTAQSLICRLKNFTVRPLFDNRISHREERIKFMSSASMEQLWLAFTMNELYKKRWNDSEWVEDKEMND